MSCEQKSIQELQSEKKKKKDEKDLVSEENNQLI